MPLISKPNYNQIFASQAPEQDKPAVFNNYPGGWGVESRPNNGKPTIKGFNYLQQASDLKDLWILQNGACLPYDESIEYADGAPVLKDGVIQYKTASGFKSRDAVTIPTYNNAADGVDPVTGVADGAYFNVRSSSDESYIDEYQNVGGSAVATGKSYLSALGVQQQEKSAATIKDSSGKDQQQLNDIYSSQLLTTAQFGVIIPEVDDTGRLQRAFDTSFDRQQKLYLVGNFNCSNTVYARHSFDGSSSILNYPTDYNKDMLVFGAEKSVATTTRVSNKNVYFPKVITSKTSSGNDWTSNTGSRAIVVVNAQECKFDYQETAQSEYGIYLLAYNTDSNYNQHNFCRHVFHKRPFTSHVDGSVSVASMNQNIYNGGRFAVAGSTARVSGIYLIHFLITGGSISSINNNTINNPSVEGASDEYAILFEAPDNVGSISYNIITAARLESGNVENKKIGLRGDRTRWNMVIGGYGVGPTSIYELDGAAANMYQNGMGAWFLNGSFNAQASISLQNTSGGARPTLAIFQPNSTMLEKADAVSHATMYCTTNQLITRSTTAERFRLSFNNGRLDWSGGTESGFDTNLYRGASGQLKTDGSLSVGVGLGLFGSTPPSSKRSIIGKNSPTTIAEQNAVLDSIVAALVAYGLVSDGRTT